MIWKVSAEDIAIRGNGTGLEYMCPTRHFVYIFFNPVFQVSTAKNEINLFNNHILIVAPVTFAPAGAMTPSAEFLFNFTKNYTLSHLLRKWIRDSFFSEYCVPLLDHTVRLGFSKMLRTIVVKYVPTYTMGTLKKEKKEKKDQQTTYLMILMWCFFFFWFSL